MFEKFFGPKSSEEKEAAVKKAASKEFEMGVNATTMFLAFKMMRQENEEKGYGLTHNHLLNILRDEALASSTSIEDYMYGGPEQTAQNIKEEIERLRSSLTEEEKSS